MSTETLPDRRFARRARHLTDEQYAALPTASVWDRGHDWGFQCDCGRSHIVESPLAEGDVLFCPRSKREYRCL